MTMLADVARDFRYAGRSLLRTPGFTVVAVAVLALGIGATSAIFSLVSAVWLKPLPFMHEERLVSLWLDLSSIGGPPRLEATPANYSAWRERAQSFEEITPVVPSSVNLTGSGEPERLAAVRTTPNLFEPDGPYDGSQRRWRAAARRGTGRVRAGTTRCERQPHDGATR